MQDLSASANTDVQKLVNAVAAYCERFSTLVAEGHTDVAASVIEGKRQLKHLATLDNRSFAPHLHVIIDLDGYARGLGLNSGQLSEATVNEIDELLAAAGRHQLVAH